ncbi:hypothetical protein J6W91_01035, partial [Candidatus Saccharibacteria bacterium]|nr:hypothetical protein [Candidatus Saccharibacteria bacterium]
MNKKVFFLTLCLFALTLSITGCADKQVQEERELKIETVTENIQEEEPKITTEIEEVKEVEEVIEPEEPKDEEIIEDTPEEIQEEVELPSQDSYWDL